MMGNWYISPSYSPSSGWSLSDWVGFLKGGVPHLIIHWNRIFHHRPTNPCGDPMYGNPHRSPQENPCTTSTSSLAGGWRWSCGGRKTRQHGARSAIHDSCHVQCLKNISQLGCLFPIYAKIKNVPNHQPVVFFVFLLSYYSIQVSSLLASPAKILCLYVWLPLYLLLKPTNEWQWIR